MGLSRLISLLVSAIVVLGLSSYPVDATSNQDVIQLTSRNFDAEVGSGGIWIVEFYAEWCGHCKKFEPTYKLIAQKLHGKNDKKTQNEKIFVAKVDGSKERVLSSRFNLRGYPTFFVIDEWDVYEFQGIRSLDSVTKFVERDYKKQQPLRFYNSPFGPIGQTKALVMKVGTMVLDQYQMLTEEKKISPLVATMLIAAVGVVVGTFIILVFGLLLVSKVSKQKND